jgi:hypothetical protein
MKSLLIGAAVATRRMSVADFYIVWEPTTGDPEPSSPYRLRGYCIIAMHGYDFREG